jgi:hypothetical protein
MSPWKRAVLAIVGLSALARPAAGAEPERDPFTLAVGFRGAQQSGLLTVDSLWRVVRLYERAFPTTEWRPAVVGIAARLGVAALVDAPLAEIVGTIQHEVFGHAARAEDIGLLARPELVVPRPYAWLIDGQGGGAHSNVAGLATVSPTLRAAVQGDGIAANHAHATIIARRAFVSGAWQGRGDAFAYVGSRLVYAPSFFSTSGLGGGLDTPGAGDVSGYATSLVAAARLRGARPGIDARTHLRLAYLWNFFDPFLVSAVVAGVRFLATGEERSAVGGIAIGDSVLMPRPSFALTPFGPEQGIGAWWKRRKISVEAGVRHGSFAGIRSMRANVRVEVAREQISYGGVLEAWQQPEIRDGPLGNDRVGGTFAGFAAWDATSVPLGLGANVGVKTAGFSDSLPLDGGLYGWIGLRVRHP